MPPAVAADVRGIASHAAFEPRTLSPALLRRLSLCHVWQAVSVTAAQTPLGEHISFSIPSTVGGQLGYLQTWANINNDDISTLVHA